MGQHLGRGVGLARSGKTRKKNETEKSTWWLGPEASGGRGGSELGRGDGSLSDWASEMG